MPQLQEIADDLAFVRRTISEPRPTSFPGTILFLWAGIILVGSILTDLSPRSAGYFWFAAGPIGGIISAYLGRQWSRASGTINPIMAQTQMLHWGALIVAVFASQILVAVGSLRGSDFGSQVLLLAALAYYYAGLHMHRSLMWLAGVHGASYLIATFAPGLPSSFNGVLLAIGFVWVGTLARRRLTPTSYPTLVI